MRFTRYTMSSDLVFSRAPIGFYRADCIVEGRVALEVKATRALDHADWRQLLNVLRGTRLELGLLLHFGPKASFKRLVFDNQRKWGLPVYARSVAVDRRSPAALARNGQ